MVELLVTTLIIGILAAVGVASYDKAVLYSRASEIKNLVRSLATAQTAYFLESNAYPDSFEALDINLSLTPYTGSDEVVAGVAKADVVTKDNKFVLILNKRGDGWVASAAAYIGDGLMQHTGFMIVHSDPENQFPIGELLCVSTSDACVELFEAKKIGTKDGFNVFRLE